MKYLGIKVWTFDHVVSPFIPEVRIGRKRFFDLLDLEHYVEQNKCAVGGPRRKLACQDLQNEVQIGTSRKSLSADRNRWKFEKAQEQATARKRKKS